MIFGTYSAQQRASDRSWPHTAAYRLADKITKTTHFRTHGGPCCQEARLSDLVTCGSRAAGLGDDCCCGFSSSLPVVPSRGPGSSWSARSRVAARTNELDAGERRPMIGSEEEPSGSGCRGRAGWVGFPGDVLAGGVVSHAPIRHRAGQRDAMTVTSGGPGCSVRSSSAAWGPAHAKTRAYPGPGDPSGLVGVPPLAAASRW